MRLLERFYNSLVQSGAIPCGSRVLVAVSGGADSLALLLLLHHVAGRLDLHLEAAHLDHGLRQASGDDARFVARFCAGLGIPLAMERRDVAAIAAGRRGNLEEVAREERRDFLLSTARLRSCQWIALGHHADDQAETFLMRLLRGSGVAGLAGMQIVSAPLVRPLLPFRHAELVAYLEEEQVSWREDASNLDTRFTRNRIRHDLLPLLATYNANIPIQLAGLCEQLQEDNAFWSELVTQELARCGGWQDDVFSLDCRHLLAVAPALASRLVRAALEQVRGDLRGLTAGHVADVLKLAAAGSSQGELDLPGAWVARRYERLNFRQERPAKAESLEFLLDAPGHYRLTDNRTLTLSLEEQVIGESAGVVEFAAAAVPFPLHLRTWQAGDRFQPSGMRGTKKLQDLFVDLKLSREERQRVLVLLQGNEILWVIGVRRCAGRRPEGGERVLRIVATGLAGTS